MNIKYMLLTLRNTAIPLEFILTNGNGFALMDDGNFLLYNTNTKAANQEITHIEDIDDLDFSTIQSFKLLNNY